MIQYHDDVLYLRTRMIPVLISDTSLIPGKTAAVSESPGPQ